MLCSGDTYSNGSTGGSATHLHGTTAIALTEAQLPEHRHKQIFIGSDEVNDIYWGAGLQNSNKDAWGFGYRTNGSSINNILYTGYTGSGATHSHGNTTSTSTLPPYLAVTVWKRVA